MEFIGQLELIVSAILLGLIDNLDVDDGQWSGQERGQFSHYYCDPIVCSIKLYGLCWCALLL